MILLCRRHALPWLLAGLLSANAQQTTGVFLTDLMPRLASTGPALIMDPDHGSLWEWATYSMHLTAVVDGQREAASKIVDHLNSLIEEELVDLIFFMEPLPAKLVSDVTGGLKNINLRKVNVFVPQGAPHGLKLRLDTRLYMYRVDGEVVNLFESYYIRQDPYREMYYSSWD